MIDKDGFIMDLATNISRYYWDKYGEIDPEIIADQNNISYSYGNYGSSFDGMLEFNGKSFHIYINDHGYKKSARAKFTFAHELGHFYIPEHSISLINFKAPAHCSITGYKSENVIEREADLFAANLLMPKELVLKLYLEYKTFSFDAIIKIQSKFGVSILAALYRFFNLDLHPLIIVKSKDGIIEKVIRGNNIYFKLKDRLPPESLSFQYFKSKAKSDKSKKMYVLDWCIEDNTKELFEHCIYYDSLNTVYSILWLK